LVFNIQSIHDARSEKHQVTYQMFLRIWRIRWKGTQHAS